MKFSVIVSASPEHPASRAALEFCLSLQRNKHSIYRLFFLQDGVKNAQKNQKISEQWRKVIKEHAIDAVCCAGSAQVHKLADSLGNPAQTLQEGFSVAGLGLLVEAEKHCDRSINFG